MSTETTILKNKSDILANEANRNSSLSWTDISVQSQCCFSAMDRWAEYVSTEFVKWRSRAAEKIQHRYKLNLPLKDQFELFIKENGL